MQKSITLSDTDYNFLKENIGIIALKDIADKVGCHVNTIYNYSQDMNSIKRRNKAEFNKKYIAAFINLTSRIIAEDLGVSESTVSIIKRWLKNNKRIEEYRDKYYELGEAI